MKKFFNKSMMVLALTLAMFLLPISGVFAQDAPVDPAIADLSMGLNILWVFFAAVLVFFMQAGFALVETGFTRSKNVAHTMMMNLMVFCIGAIGYWLTGFAFQFGGVNHVFPAVGSLGEWAFSPVTLGDWTGILDQPLLIGGHQVLGLSGFLLSGLTANVGVLVFFMYQMFFMDTAATIPTGSMAERLKFSGFVLMGLFVSMIIYPIVGNWVWGGGWLANLGRTAGLGSGVVDFAGSGVVHMVGGALGLAGAIVLGPRIGRFNKDGTANAIPGHNFPMGVLGTIILFFGWFGFNAGSSLGFLGGFRNLAGLAAVNTLLAGAAGGMATMCYMWFIHKLRKPDPAMSVNGLLAGLVAVTAPCAFIDPLSAVIIGIIAGIVVVFATEILEKFKIDDPVGAVPVHLVGGALGVLAVGIFANGNPDSAGWNGIASPVTGLLYGNAGQLLAQIFEILAVLLVVFPLSYAFFRVLHALKLLRSEAADEIAGLDVPEMGTPGYINDGPIAGKVSVPTSGKKPGRILAPSAAD
jgi:Amt family ammonium transporter